MTESEGVASTHRDGVTVEGNRMNEMVTGSDQGLGTSVSSPVAVPASTSVEAVPQEKLFKQSEVNDLVGRAKQEAIDRYKRETSYASHQSPAQQSAMQQPLHASMNSDDFRRMAAEEAQRLMDQRHEDAQRKVQEQEAQRIASEFFTKLSVGRQQFTDFDTVMQDMDFAKIGNTVQLARGFDNVAAMMYHLRKHPTQLASIEMLTYQNPKLAYEELTRLSQSIKTNDDASRVKLPNEPLSQLRPSNTSTDTGAMSVRDLRAKYRG